MVLLQLRLLIRLGTTMYKPQVTVQLLLVLAGVDAKWTLDNFDFLIVDFIKVFQMLSRIDRGMSANVALVLALDLSRWQLMIRHLIHRC